MNRIIFSRIIAALIAIMLTGCVQADLEVSYDPEIADYAGDDDKSKSIFVFMDGTGNDEDSQTNVFRLFDLVKNDTNRMTAIYIPGVGPSARPRHEIKNIKGI